MTTFSRRYEHGSEMGWLVSTGAIAAGTLVAADQTVTTNGSESIVVAGAAGLKVVGVTANDAAVAGTDAANVAFPRPTMATVYTDGVVWVKFAAATKLGDRLKPAATGQVTPFVDGTDTDASLKIGVCWQASVASGAFGWMRLTL